MAESVIRVVSMKNVYETNKVKIESQEEKYINADASDEEQEEVYRQTTPLRLIVTKPRKTRHPQIPVSYFDAITFYRAFYVTVTKHCNIFIRFHYISDFNRVIRMLFFRMFEGVIVATFIQIFLGIYVPGQHIYITKIAPVFAGAEVLHFAAAVIELTRFADIVVVFFAYLFEGFYNKNPWNRCPAGGVFGAVFRNQSLSVQCLPVPEFRRAVRAGAGYHYARGHNYSCFYHQHGAACITLPQILFNFHHYASMTNSLELLKFYYILVWLVVLFFCNTIFKPHIWRTLTYVNLSLFTCHLVALIYMKVMIGKHVKPQPVISEEVVVLSIWEHLQFLFSGYVQTPPVIHIITARQEDKAHPGRDSTLIILTNTLYSILYFYIHHEINVYAAVLVGIDINPVMNSFYIDPVLHYMFIFFWKLDFGNLYTLLYLSLTAIQELLVLAITFQLLIELVISQYEAMPKIIAIISVFIVALTLNVSIERKNLVLMSAFLKGALMAAELAGVFLLYPVQRLLDDLAFHYGTKPAAVWRWMLVTYPIFVIRWFFNINWIIEDDVCFTNMEFVFYCMSVLTLLTLGSGAVYMLLRLKWNKSHWTHLFQPTKDWGPENFAIRQLRKRFWSSGFEFSSAPKMLSRFLCRNAEPQKYRVDVRYEEPAAPRRARTVADCFMLDDDDYD